MVKESNGVAPNLVILVHGFNVGDEGKKSVGRIKKPLGNYLASNSRDVDIYRFGYDYTFVFRLGLRNQQAGEALGRILHEEQFRRRRITVVTHSNGVVVAEKAQRMRPVRAQLIAINPALRPNHQFHARWDAVDVLCNECDTAVRLGAAWAALTRVFPWRWCNPHPWGSMGAGGPSRPDARVRVHRVPCRLGHSGAVRDAGVVRNIVGPSVRDYLSASRDDIITHR